MVDTKTRANARQQSVATKFTFDHWQLDAATRELSRDGVLVPIAPQSFSLLACLLGQHRRVLSANELLTEIWPDAVVGEGSLRLAVFELRKALGDTGGEQRYVRTVRGQGYRFVGAVDALVDDETPAVPSNPLLGRAAECAQLDSFLSVAARGVRVCCVVGPQGMGTSRLLQYAQQRAEERGFRVACASPTDAPGVHALSPWPELLQSLVASSSRAARAQCKQLAPSVYSSLIAGSVLPTEWLSLPGVERQHAWLQDELMRLVEAAAKERPTVLMIDDLHEATEVALAFLAQLAGQTTSASIVVIAGCRTTSAAQARPLHRALKQVVSAPSSLRIDLAALSPAAGTQLVLSAAPTLDAALALEAHQLSGGNPMFMLELARLLQQLGRSGPAALRSLDGGIGQVIHKRLQMLPADALRVVMAASVLGHELGIAQLAFVLRTTPRLALQRIEEPERQGMLSACATRHTVSFAHSLLREQANALLSRDERSDLHLRAAEWLEDADSEDPRTLAQLAHHFLAAATSGGAEKAIRYARRCAQHALACGDHREAALQLEHALACCDLAGATALERLRLRIEKAEAERLVRPTNAALSDTLAALAERALSAGEQPLFVRAVLIYAGQTASHFAPTRFSASTDRRELGLIERALGSTLEPCAERALLLCALAYALVYTTSDQRRIAACKEAITIARQLQHPWLLARALMMRGYACAAPGDYAERLSSCSELIALLEEHGFRELELEARMRRALCLLEAGDARQAERDEVRATQLAQLLSAPRLRIRSELLALLRAFGQGSLQSAQAMSECALTGREDDPTARAIHLVRMACLQNLRHGISTELVVMHEALVRAHPDTIGFRCSLASIYAVAGRQVEAGEQFDWVARDEFRSLPKNLNWLSELSLLADTAVSLDDAQRAAQVYAVLAPFGDRWLIFAGEAAPGGPIAYWLCNLASALRAYDVGLGWLARARALTAAMNAPLFEKFVDLAEARLLLACRVEGRLRRAEALLKAVTSFAEQHELRCLSLCAADIAARHGMRSARVASTSNAPLAE